MLAWTYIRATLAADLLLGLFSLDTAAFAQEIGKATQTVDVQCKVEGRCTIASIVPAGTLVKKGQVICELDSTAIRAMLSGHQAVRAAAYAAYQSSRRVAEGAEKALSQYNQVTSKGQLTEVRAKIHSAESELSQSAERFKAANQAWAEMNISRPERVAEGLNHLRAKLSLELALCRLRSLEDFTIPKTKKKLKRDVDRAQSDVKTRLAAWKLEEEKEGKMQRHLEAYRVQAPVDGKVLQLKMEPTSSSEMAQTVAQGTPVYEGDMLIQIVKFGSMTSAREGLGTKGRLKAEIASSFDVYCPVWGKSIISCILPEGRFVRTGECICELDPVGLREVLSMHQLIVNRAEETYRASVVEREIAELAVREYDEGFFLEDLTVARVKVKEREFSVSRARDKVEFAKKLLANGLFSPAQKEYEERTLEREEVALNKARKEEELLRKQVKPATDKELNGELEKARAAERAKRQTWELEKAREAEIEKQMGKCRISAPIDGKLSYLRVKLGHESMSNAGLHAGSSVQYGQLLVRIALSLDRDAHTKAQSKATD